MYQVVRAGTEVGAYTQVGRAVEGAIRSLLRRPGPEEVQVRDGEGGTVLRRVSHAGFHRGVDTILLDGEALAEETVCRLGYSVLRDIRRDEQFMAHLKDAERRYGPYIAAIAERGVSVHLQHTGGGCMALEAVRSSDQARLLCLGEDFEAGGPVRDLTEFGFTVEDSRSGAGSTYLPDGAVIGPGAMLTPELVADMLAAPIARFLEGVDDPAEGWSRTAF